MRQLWDEREAKSKDVVLKGGVQLVQIEDKEKWAEAVKPVYEQFAAAPELKSLIEEIQAAK
jgi:TRAP-type C4-dicarboxylate transport system substrate-binding protein